MREVALPEPPRSHSYEAATFAACVATILELSLDDVPEPADGEDVAGWRVMRWVMYGVPSGVAWDPSGVTQTESWRLDGGLVISALDIALARPPLPSAPRRSGSVEAVYVSPQAGAPAERVERVAAMAGLGLEGDRHVTGRGTFPSGLPGSALTLIEAEVCDSFTPSLGPDEHRRSIVTRGITLNDLVGHEFLIGSVPCRGMRLCEPCTVVQRYSSRPVLRPLVHRGGLRADILEDGVIGVGDTVRARARA